MSAHYHLTTHITVELFNRLKKVRSLLESPEFWLTIEIKPETDKDTKEALKEYLAICLVVIKRIKELN